MSSGSRSGCNASPRRRVKHLVSKIVSITLVEGLQLLESVLPAEDAKRRLRQAFVQKAFRQEPLFAFQYDEADIDWTTGSVKIPRKRERFCPTFSRAEFNTYFFKEEQTLPDRVTRVGAPREGDMANEEISEEGRRARFEQWEKLGLDRVKGDLQADPYCRIGSGAVQNLAWEWVRMKDAEQVAAAAVEEKPADDHRINREILMPPLMSVERRRLVLASTSILKALGHSGFDRMLLELGVPEDVGTGSGLLARTTSLGRFVLSNPHAKEYQGSLFSDAIIKRAQQLRQRGVMQNLSEDDVAEYEEALASDSGQAAPLAGGEVSVPRVGLDTAQPYQARPINAQRPKARRSVFIVHGHEEGPREAVARFLEALEFDPVILHERPNKGRTIITKFQQEAADVGFAVVLMTPDDSGGKVGGDVAMRPRQNVVFELGFFIGVLGPERVVALVKGQVERPSDFDGVVYIPFDEHSGWKGALARELEAAGFEVDRNKAS